MNGPIVEESVRRSGCVNPYATTQKVIITMIMNMMMISDCVNYKMTFYVLMKLKSVEKAVQNVNCY